MATLVINNRILEKTWQTLLALFCVSVFTSKSGISIFGVLLILLSLFLINWQELWRERKEIILFVALYPLAIFLSLFSLGGVQSALKVSYSWPWVLLALPAYVVFKREQDQKVALVSSCLGLVVACGLSYFIFFRDFGGVFDASVRVGSFWDISRWGLFLASSLMGFLALIIYFWQRGQKTFATVMQVMVVAVSVSLILSNTRAPWLAAALGGLVFTVLFPRILKFFALLAVFVGLCLVLSQGLRERALSVFNVQKTAEGKITSSDRSNEGRLNMWHVGLEFFREQPWFGTGFENTEKALNEFIDSKPGYREKYVTSEFSFRDQHSSYLTMLVQMGALFSAVFWGVYVLLILTLLKSWYKTRSVWSGAVVSLIVVHSLIFVFYTSFQSYEMVALFPFLPLIPKKTA